MQFNFNLGNHYSPEQTTFRVYCTNAESVCIRLYENANTYHCRKFRMNLTQDKNVYEFILQEDLKGVFYDYVVTRDKKPLVSTDPYSISSSVNSKRSVVLDIDNLKISGFDEDKFVDIRLKKSIIYESHIRDMTMHESGNFINKGKFIGLCENTDDPNIGLGFIKAMGYTHVHYLPLQDFYSVDELSGNQYNWGYDPENYFTIEGSYCTDPENPEKRILEFQEMVKKHHDLNLGVVVDVVYNHVYRAHSHAFSVLAPELYFRRNMDNSLSNGSGCGNELNTEHPLVRDLIVKSLKHFMNVYHIDGFRFDLMGLIDQETMRIIDRELRVINKNVLLYGEPWTGGDSTLDPKNRSDKSKAKDIKVALFNDDFRNALKGDNDGYVSGFLQGDLSNLHDVLTGIAGSINYNEYHIGFAAQPYESINYLSSHDNLILYDKMRLSTDYSEEKIMQITGIGFAILLLSFGIPFIQAGTDFMRSKKMNSNSYNAPDDINAVDWSYVQKNKKLVEFVQSLIKLRNELGFFADYDADDIRANLDFIGSKDLVSYRINPKNEEYKCIHILINSQDKDIDLQLLPDESIEEIFHNKFIAQEDRKIVNTGDGIFHVKAYDVIIFEVHDSKLKK